MNLYMFLNKVVTIFLSTTMTTTLVFERPVLLINKGLHRSDIVMKVSSDRRVVILKALRPDINTNLMLMNNSGAYNFNLRVSSENPHRYLVIRRGREDKRYKKVKVSHSFFDLYEGETSYFLRNKTGHRVDINGENVFAKGNVFLPKNAPIIINDQRVMF